MEFQWASVITREYSRTKRNGTGSRTIHGVMFRSMTDRDKWIGVKVVHCLICCEIDCPDTRGPLFCGLAYLLTYLLRSTIEIRFVYEFVAQATQTAGPFRMEWRVVRAELYQKRDRGENFLILSIMKRHSLSSFKNFVVLRIELLNCQYGSFVFSLLLLIQQ